MEAIKEFDETAAINIVGNTVNTVNDQATGQLFQFNPTFNPIDKWAEEIAENRKLYEARKAIKTLTPHARLLAGYY